MRDTTFYDRESTHYSEKRYPAIAATYTQYFYLRRLDIVKQYLARSLGTTATLLEVGCADGVVIRSIAAAFPQKLSRIVGVDIAEEMIRVAQSRNTSPAIHFCIRRDLPESEQFDAVLEVGVVNYASVEEELRAARMRMRADARYILSIAGTDSLKNQLKGEDGFNDFRSYRTYEALIKRDFLVESVIGCGVLVPYLWRAPRLARLLQSHIEWLVNVCGLRRLCHEQVFLLKKK